MPPKPALPEKKPTFDIEEMYRLFQEMLPTEEDLALLGDSQSDVVVMLGASGAGKSTTICALKDTHLTIGKKSRVSNSVEYNNEIIGHGKSHTKKFKVYSLPSESNGRKVLILDTPGFYDTDGVETVLAISLALKRILKNNGIKIKGFATVLEASSLSGRAKGALELLDLLSQLTDEISSKNLLFCITKLPDSSDVENQQIKKELLGEIKTLKNRLATEQIQIFGSVTEDNLLLLKNLDKQDECSTIKKLFAACVNQMTGFKESFGIAMDGQTRSELLRLSENIARKATLLLEEKKRIRVALLQLGEKVKLANELIHRFSQVRDQLADVNIQSSVLTEKKMSIDQKMNLLSKEADEMQTAIYPLPIQIPKKNTGVAVCYHYTKDISIIPRYTSIESNTDKRITVRHTFLPTSGEIMIDVCGEFTENDRQPELSVQYKKSALPDFQEKQKEVLDEHLQIARKESELENQRKNLEQELERIKINSRRLELDAHLFGKTPKEIIAALEVYYRALIEKREQEEQKEISNEFAPEKITTLSFYCDVIKFADLERGNPSLKKFVALYDDCYPAENHARNLSLSLLRSGAAMFGGGGAAAELYFTNQNQSANENASKNASAASFGQQ